MTGDAARPTRVRASTDWMDLARVVAMTAVVLIHVLAPAVNGRWLDIGSPAWWVANVLESATRWCVPLFIMLSGALLLDPDRVQRPRDFYRRRLARVGVPLVVWTVVYLVFRRIGLGENLSAEDAAADVLLGTPFLQLYFLYILVGLYLLAPFLKIIVRHTTTRMQAGLAGVLLLLGMVDQVAASVTGVSATAATRFLPFAGYFVLGWVLRDLVLRRRLIGTAWLAFGLSVVVTAVLVGVISVDRGWGEPGRYLYGFLSPAVVVASATVFLLLRDLGTRWAARPPRTGAQRGTVLAWLSASSFGVFLVHPLVLYPLQDAWPLPTGLAPFLRDATLHLLITLAASLLLTRVLLAVPYLRRTVS